jgi:hypothetical protein
MIEVNLVEIAKLNLGPEDVLSVKVQSDEITIEHVSDLKNRLQAFFPNNKIMMMVIPTNSSVELQVITKEKA